MPFVIMGKYEGGDWEEIDEAETKPDLRYLLGEYKLAFGPGWQFRTKRR
jgi:hypothetical protein|tara:strand:+ start:7849 stop:7995 length:147 start_codon:yes stop_codon:yes gene_type:complete